MNEDKTPIGTLKTYEDPDGKAVFEFEGKITTNVDLLTKAQDIAGAINELFQLDPGGGDVDDWQPPDDWLTVPEPAPYEICYLIEVANASQNNISLELCNPVTRDTGQGTVRVDWGDGNSNTYEEYWGGNITHSYSQDGQFIIKIATDDRNRCSQGLYNNAVNIDLLICKSGANIVYTTENYGDNLTVRWRGNGGISKLHYFKHLGSSSLARSCFSQCFYLKKVEFTEPIKVIPSNCFENCFTLQNIDLSEVTKVASYGLGYLYGTMLKKISLPKCITVDNYAFNFSYGISEIDLPVCQSIGSSAFNYCQTLGKINAPKCEEVGSGAFSTCYILKKAVFAENCTFGTNCFYQCYNLDPHPDGSET